MRFFLRIVLFSFGPIALSVSQPIYAQGNHACYMVLPSGAEVDLTQLCWVEPDTAEVVPSVEELATLYPYASPEIRLGLWYMHNGRQTEAQAELAKIRAFR